MLQVIRTVAVTAIAVGVSIANSEAILVPVVMAVLGVVLLKISEVMEGEAE